MTKDNTQILQFGTGKFLRGFVDLFAQQAIDNGSVVSPITVVQSTGIERVMQMRSQDFRYKVYIRGFLGNQEVQDDILAGYVLDKSSVYTGSCPKSFPAKLLSALMSRYNADLSDVTVAPCELIENNGNTLFNIVIDQAKVWGVEDDCLEWIREDVVWLNTLVDRIVASPSNQHNGVQTETLDVMTEPYALWAIQSSNKGGLPFEHDAIESCDNL